MESKTSRYQSRILREMHQNKENPFNSPPSSTGSHGTVTLTSDLSYGPEGESTRRMQDSILLPDLPNKQTTSGAQTTPFRVNTSAIGRNFPEWNGWDANDQTDDLYNVTGDYEKQQRKENIPPSSSTVNSPSQMESRKASLGTFGARAHMQPRVEDESDYSGNVETAMSGHKRPGSASKKGASWKPQRGNVTSLIQTLKAAQAAQDSTPKKPSPRAHAPERQSSVNRHSRISDMNVSPATPNQTARSFFLPNLEHINDFVSGVLRLSSVKNGIPVFVKHGRVHDRESKSSPDHHAELDAIEIPRDEQEIFVSLDKIRGEIQTLQAHDDQVSKQAEQLQDEIYELQVQLLRYKSRKDSAMGSDSESSVVDFLSKEKAQLEEKVTTLQAKLDKANRKISISEIHTQSYVTERDEALRSASAHAEKISNLQAQLDATRSELNVVRGGGSIGNNLTSGEIQSLRDENISLRSQYQSLLEENQSLRSHNVTITQQNTELQHEAKRLQRLLDAAQEDRNSLQKELDNATEQNHSLEVDQLSLERHNEKYYTENKSLQQKISLLERRVHDLQDNNAQLHQMLDIANAETGTMTFDLKDIKNRLEKKTVNLSDENAQLQQQIIELQESFASRRVVFEQEKRRLVAENERLHNKLDKMSQSFERVLQESRREFEEQRDSLTQQLDEVAGREAALASQLKDTAEQETTLQQHIQRRNEMVEEARRMSKEIESLQAHATKNKPIKITRIIEPTTTRSRSTFSEVSAKSTTDQLGTQEREDFTQQFDLTQGSDIDVLPKEEMDKLRETLRRTKSGIQHNAAEEYLDDEAEADHTEEVSQSLPPFMPQIQRESVNKADPATGKRQPSGILKNVQASRRLSEQDLTGRFSVKSALSGLSLPSQTTRSDVSVNRRHSDSDRFDLDVEENMTSALFMDDITLDARKRAARKEKTRQISQSNVEAQSSKAPKKRIATLSSEAKRVLDGLCNDHVCSNCIMCVRINAHKHEGDVLLEAGKKKTITVERPIPVTDRIANPVSADADITMRPAQQPGVALATVLKGLEDELAHLKLAIARKNNQLNAMDPSVARRQRKQVNSELQRLMRLRDMKQDQIYRVHDVIEGQKQAGQQMSQAEYEVTVSSIQNMMGDETWDGILDDC
ncbi:rhoptry protein [Seiridium cupressi]